MTAGSRILSFLYIGERANHTNYHIPSLPSLQALHSAKYFATLCTLEKHRQNGS